MHRPGGNRPAPVSQGSSNISRRSFLEKSAAAAAAVAAPSIIPASALGADGSVAPSNRIVMSQIGCNWIGNSHFHGLLGNPRVQFVGACELMPDRLEKMRSEIDKRYGEEKRGGAGSWCRTYHDFREMLAAPDIDAVVIAVPDHWHAPMAVRAAREGKDIYCEKPMSLTIRQARAMVDAVRRYGRVFQTGSQQRSEFGAHFIRCAELVRSGRIGRVTEAWVGVGGPPREYDMEPQPVPEGFDFDMWLGPAPEVPYNEVLCPQVLWRWFREFCGGGFADMGAHHFDIVQWCLGMDDSGPVRITPPDGGEVENLTFEYANGVKVYHGGSIDVDIRGTEGRIMAARGYLRAEPEEILQEPLGPNDVHLNRHRGHRDDWLDCIESRRRPIADVEIGCRSATVCHLGNIAFQLGRPLRWNPETENFIGDSEAQRLVDRAMRSPWEV